MMESLAVLYTQGAGIDWLGVYGRRRRVQLPTYPFQRKRYWTSIQPPAAREEGAQTVDPAAVWAALGAAAEFQAGQSPLDLQLATYAAKWEALRALSSGYIVAALQNLGGFPTASPIAATALAAQWGVTAGYAGLVTRWLKRLAAEGVLVQTDEGFAAPKLLHGQRHEGDELQGLREQARALLADAPMLFEYVERCGPRLAGVVTGKVQALDTLFPGGSSALAEALYQEWGGSRYFAHLMRAILQAYAAAKGGARPSQPLRVLEVGAGTGATTAALLPMLAAGSAGQASYEFTDVSELFLGRAAAKFAAYDFVRYGRLDLEQPPAEQGYAPGSYDVIVATNVLHATADLHATLDHVYGLLAPGGLLLVNEVTEHLAWYDITTGLIEGWQRFDDDLRQDQPLLDAPLWERALAGHGFASVAAWPQPESPAAVLGQRVIAAAKGGEGIEEATGQEAARRIAHAMDGDARHAQGSARPAGEIDTLLLRRRLQEAVADERNELLFAFVGSRIRQVLRLDDDAVLEATNRLLDLGLDSLMALELRRLLAAGSGLAEDALSATLVFDYPTVGALVAQLGSQLQAEDAPPVSQPAQDGGASTGHPVPAAEHEQRRADIAEMSDDEVEALLLQKLNKLS